MTGNGPVGRALDGIQRRVKQIRTTQLTLSSLLARFVSVPHIKAVLLYYSPRHANRVIAVASIVSDKNANERHKGLRKRHTATLAVVLYFQS